MRKLNKKQKHILMAIIAVVALLVLSPWLIKWMKQYNPCADPFVLRGITPGIEVCMFRKAQEVSQEAQEMENYLAQAKRQAVQLQAQIAESKDREAKNVG